MQPCVKTSISTDKAKSGKTWAQVHETGQQNRINGLVFRGTEEVVKKKHILLLGFSFLHKQEKPGKRMCVSLQMQKLS